MSEELSEWDRFILRHQNPGNLFIHFISWLMFFGGPLLAIWKWNFWYLGLFFTSGWMGAFGHFVFKDSGVSLKEATSSAMVPVYVTRMLWSLLKGDYWSQVERARKIAVAQGLLKEV